MSHAAPVAPFDPDTEPATNAQRWTKWVRRFDNYLAAANITCDSRKKALLLWLAGERVHDIFDTIGDDEDTYTSAIDKLNKYFQPMRDLHVSIYHFREAAQGSDTIDQYVTKLRALAKSCDFQDVAAEIRAQILQKTSSRSLRREILKHP